LVVPSCSSKVMADTPPSIQGVQRIRHCCTSCSEWLPCWRCSLLRPLLICNPALRWIPGNTQLSLWSHHVFFVINIRLRHYLFHITIIYAKIWMDSNMHSRCFIECLREMGDYFSTNMPYFFQPRICRHILFVVSEVAYARIDCINWVGLSTVRTFRVHLSQTSDLWTNELETLRMCWNPWLETALRPK